MRLTATAYLCSHLLSLFGNAIAAVALPLVLLQVTGSVLSAGALAAATVVPAVLAGLFAGVVIDRINRRTASVVTDLISAAAVAALPLVDRATGLTLAWFILFGVLGSLGDVPGMTAREALLPAVVRHSGMAAEQLVGLRESAGALAVLIGPALAGALFLLLDGTAVLWVTAATSAAAALITLLIPHEVGRIERVAEKPGRPRLLVGLHHLWASPFLRVTTGVSLVMVVVLSGLQSLVLPVHFLASGDEAQLGFVLSALAFGSLAGAGAYAGLGARGSRRAGMLICFAGTVGGFVLVALLPATWLLLVGAGVVGLSSGWLGGLMGVLSLERVPEHLRGRVLGSQNAVLTAAPALGVVAAAVITHRTEIGVAAIGLAVVWALAAAVAARSPALRCLDPATASDPATAAASAGKEA
ncbi:MFS transporter [Actinoplanes sp. DH11]|uniref:MFS transporter n=1 Tax=Actinoplanes sp. DH11 TaxID=2857011 RepID=UPI001E625960|nr:MFS transporter [Actinoplanes sp. DH11]